MRITQGVNSMKNLIRSVCVCVFWAVTFGAGWMCTSQGTFETDERILFSFLFGIMFDTIVFLIVMVSSLVWKLCPFSSDNEVNGTSNSPE